MNADDRDMARSQARGAELREELAVTDARRAEEQVAEQRAHVEDARKEERKLSRKERKAAERAKQAAAEAERARQRTAPENGARVGPPPTAATSAHGAAAPAGPAPPLSERPEVLVGAAFGGAFLLARVLKRIFD